MRTRTPAQKTVARRRRWRLAMGLNTGVTLLLAALVAGMLHYLGARHYLRWDWSRARFYALSGKTRALLAGLTRDVDVYVFFQSGQALFPDVDNLLQEYQAASPHLRVVRVDPDRDLARAEELKQRYPLSEANVVLFACDGRSQVVKASDLAEYRLEQTDQGAARAVKHSFRGEQRFSSAIQAVTSGVRPVVYFLSGHDEGTPDSFERGTGLSDLARLIRQDNVELRTLRFGEQQQVPADASALVVAGPRLPFAQPELDALRAYLERNGRAIFLLDGRARTGLGPLLETWGVHVGNDLVVDPTRTLTGRELFVTRFANHPITEKLGAISVILYLPCSVEPVSEKPGAARPADRPRALGLAFTTPSGWADADPDDRPIQFDPARDRKGPVAVAAVVERGPVPGIDVQIQPTRLVVFGDAQFVANGALAAGNGAMFMSALNWLLSRETLMAIPPRPVEEARLRLSAGQLHLVAALVIGALPGAAAVLGLLVWLRRRA